MTDMATEVVEKPAARQRRSEGNCATCGHPKPFHGGRDGCGANGCHCDGWIKKA